MELVGGPLKIGEATSSSAHPGIHESMDPKKTNFPLPRFDLIIVLSGVLEEMDFW